MAASRARISAARRAASSSFGSHEATTTSSWGARPILLTLLFDEVSYVVYSEPELERRYADLFLMRRPEARGSGLYDLLFELKRLTLKDVGLSGKELRELDEDALHAMKPVRKALAEAEKQARSYRSVLVKRYDDFLRLKTYVVVSVGFDRLVGREIF